jgi:hypothetical protein
VKLVACYEGDKFMIFVRGTCVQSENVKKRKLSEDISATFLPTSVLYLSIEIVSCPILVMLG